MMNLKETLIVPRGIRFISEWTEFDLNKLAKKCIINKKIPGCGMTEYYLTNSYNVILASPRKILLQNKFDQHSEDVFLVKNELDQDLQIDKELETDVNLSQSGDSKDTAIIYNSISKLLKFYVDKRESENKPIKILVTYDSYHIVKDILKFLSIFDSFYTMVDEFQCFLSDAKFKSDTEISVMNSLSNVERVHFVSATPTIDKYLEKLKEFNTLPQYIFDWESEDPLRIIKPSLKVRSMMSVGSSITPIIQKYKRGDFDSIVVSGDSTVVSDEAIFYVNSVGHIVSAIKKNNLMSDQVNIICADTDYNKKRLRDKLGKDFVIGSVPLKGIKPKMFTFCTRTVYLGADFYSTNAQTYIFSDSNYDCLAVDISQDLPQILGRQRNDENPWKNSATLYYRSTSNFRKMTKEDFDKILQEKIDQSDKLLNAYNIVPKEEKVALSKKYEEVAKQKHYENDYVAVTNGVPVFNNFSYVSEIMAFDIQQVDYADRFSVFSKINNQFSDSHTNLLNNFLFEYNKYSKISDRLKFICDLYFGEFNYLVKDFINLIPNNDYAKSYYLQMGPERCRANWYQIKDIRKEISVKQFDMELLKNEIYKEFHEGERRPNEEIKHLLKTIYSSLNYPKTAKASDLREWFDVEEVNFMNNGKKVHGLKLNKRRRD